MVGEAKAWFDKIVDAPVKDRIFVIMLSAIFVLLGYDVYITRVLTNDKLQERELRIKAELKNDDLRAIIIKDNKDYTTIIADERRDCDDKWRIKFDTEREFNKKLLEERARFSEERAKRFEEQLVTLTRESQRIRNETSRIKEKVKI